MNPRDQPVREGRGDTSEQQRRFLAPTPPTTRCPHRHLPKLPKRPDAQHTRASTPHTKPTCCGSISRLLRTLRGRRGPGSAIPERLGAVPGRRWGASAAGALSVAKWRWGAAGDPRFRGEGLRAKASWPAGEVGGEAGNGEAEVLGAAGAQSPARSVRAPRTMAPWRGGDAGTVALAALVRRAGAVPALEPLPGCSALARSPGRSPGCLAPGRPRGALSAPPRPALPLPFAASSPSKFGSSSPTAMLPCFPGSQARAAQCAQGEGRLDA